MQSGCSKLYCVIRGLTDGTTFFFFISSHKRQRFPEKKEMLLNINCVFWFFLQILLNISHYKKNSAIYDYKFPETLVWSTRYSCQILFTLDFSGNIFEKIIKYQISWKSFQWEPSCSMRTDRQTKYDKASSRFSQFRASTLKKQYKIWWWRR
jgi:hypothetical protein